MNTHVRAILVQNDGKGIMTKIRSVFGGRRVIFERYVTETFGAHVDVVGRNNETGKQLDGKAQINLLCFL